MAKRFRRFASVLKTILSLLLNPRYMLCNGIAWCITNGWAYAAAAISLYFEIKWLAALSTGYLTLIWTPFTPEKILTTAIAIWLLCRLFPSDQKTLAVLKRIQLAAQQKWDEWKPECFRKRPKN